jgi:nucleoside-diphosphate-sugar epimerase
MRIIMTGATGYIGSAVADALVRANHAVTGVAHTTRARADLVERGIHVIVGDIAAPEKLADQIASDAPDAVVWVATANRADIDAPAVDAILERLQGTGAAFIYTSGAWVHGETGDAVIDEDAPLHPVELVEWRVAVERRVLETVGVRGIVIRPGIVYGHGGGIPAMMTTSARNEGAARFVGTGHNRWPLVFIEDLADLYRRAVEKAPAATVLLGVAPTTCSVLDIARAASEGAGANGRTTAWPVEDARKQLGAFADALAIDQARLSGRRAEVTLGWRPHGPSIVDELRTGSYTIVTAVRTAGATG